MPSDSSSRPAPVTAQRDWRPWRSPEYPSPLGAACDGLTSGVMTDTDLALGSQERTSGWRLRSCVKGELAECVQQGRPRAARLDARRWPGRGSRLAKGHRVRLSHASEDGVATLPERCPPLTPVRGRHERLLQVGLKLQLGGQFPRTPGADGALCRREGARRSLGEPGGQGQRFSSIGFSSTIRLTKPSA